MTRIALALSAVLAGLLTLTIGTAAAAPSTTSVRLACDNGVSATALVTLTGQSTIGAEVSLACDAGTNKIDSASLSFRATTFTFNATVTVGGATQSMTGAGSVPGRLELNPFGGHVGATLSMH